MKFKMMLAGACLAIAAACVGCSVSEQADTWVWQVHNPDAALLPPIIRAGATDDAPPSDAVVLFDGTDLSKWERVSTRPGPAWKIEDGVMLPVKGAGYVRTKEGFGSCQLHIEWVTPTKVEGTGQERGNSGVFLMGLYEVQVLDSYQQSTERYDNPTYADGQAAAIYGQKPPLADDCRAPGQWQSYDIIFHRPIFDKDGKVVKRATITVLQNGVLVQDNWEIKGKTLHKQQPYYEAHAAKLPLQIQDHGNPVKFRNIWIREIAD